MINRKSVYKCMICGNEHTDKPAKMIKCMKCRAEMREVKLGVITKRG